MNIIECYEALGGNYNNVISRFRSEERVNKYIFKFLNDQSFQTLQDALEAGSIETAFRAAHTLKGVAQNLGFDRLAESSDQITEALRAEDMLKAVPLFSKVSDDYQLTVNSITQYQTT